MPGDLIQISEGDRVPADAVLISSSHFRVLALASAKYSGPELPKHQQDFDFTYLGLITFEDPIRPEVPDAIAECQAAGIRVIMLTGDYPETAKSIAQRLKLPSTVASGPEISQIDDLMLQQTVRNTSVFARVTPDQKLRLVSALKSVGERVAMGRRGTDVAREAAAIVLLDDSFTSMVSAIRLGRRIYDNLQKSVFFILAI